MHFFADAIALKHPRASYWFRPTDLSARKLDPRVRSWLDDQGSLTKRLMGFCPGKFSVRVLSQYWVRAEIEESRLLQISPRQKVLLRQVQLLCGDRVCVYARSLIPLKTLKGKHQRLRYLGVRPLGAYLFANPRLRREQQHLARVTQQDPLFEIALSGSARRGEQIWGRRSLFTIDRKLLLVSEFFLPALFEK